MWRRGRLKREVCRPDRKRNAGTMVGPMKHDFPPKRVHNRSIVDHQPNTVSDPMNTNDDPQLEHSPLCGNVTRDGITVRVEIYRLAGKDEGWSLEVVDQEDGSTVWDELFATDKEAYAEFYRTLETEGIKAFSVPSNKSALH